MYILDQQNPSLKDVQIEVKRKKHKLSNCIGLEFPLCAVCCGSNITRYQHSPISNLESARNKYISIPEKGGTKASLQTNAQAAFFSLRFMLCVLHLRAVHHRDQFFAAGRFTSNQSCCCGLEDYPRNIAWRIFETLLFQGGWR
jgi:hypothetical protein